MTTTQSRANCHKVGFGIPGYEHVFHEDGGKIVYYPSDGLHIVIHGPPGAGKTLLALQMATGAAFDGRKNVLYLTRDTSPSALLRQAVNKFDLFGMSAGTERYSGDAKSCQMAFEKGGMHWDSKDLEGRPFLRPYKLSALTGYPVDGKASILRFLSAHRGDRSEWKHCVRFQLLESLVQSARQSVSAFVEKRRIAEMKHVAEQQDDEDKGESPASFFERELAYGLNPVLSNSLVAFGRLNPTGVPGSTLDRYSQQMHSSFAGLARLCPELAPLFHWLDRDDYPTKYRPDLIEKIREALDIPKAIKKAQDDKAAADAKAREGGDVQDAEALQEDRDAQDAKMAQLR